MLYRTYHAHRFISVYSSLIFCFDFRIVDLAGSPSNDEHRVVPTRRSKNGLPGCPDSERRRWQVTEAWMVEELPTCTNTPRQSSVEACPCRQATLDNVAHLLTVKYLQITWNIQCERHEDLVSRILYELPAWGAIGFLSVELKNRIDSVFKRLKRFGYINCTVIINDLIDRSDYELFRKVCYTIISLHHLSCRHIVQVICVRVWSSFPVAWVCYTDLHSRYIIVRSVK